MTDKPEILYGIHPVAESLQADRRRIHKVFVASGKRSSRLDSIMALAGKRGVPVEMMSVEKLAALCGNGIHQGVTVKAGPFQYSGIEDILEKGEPQPLPVLLLDHVVDPQNLGAMIRTALCAGVRGIIIPKDRSAAATPAVSRASAGALEHSRICRVTNLVNTIKTLKDAGLWIFGLDRSGSASIFSTDLSGAVGIVIGGEDTGIRPLVRKHCDGLICIPQEEGVNSLNASAAAAVVLYEALRQRAGN